MARLPQVNMTDCDIDETQGIGLHVSGEVDTNLIRTRVARSTLGNVRVDAEGVQLERLRREALAKALVAAIEGGETEAAVREEFAPKLAEKGIDFDKELARAGSLASLGQFLMQLWAAAPPA